MNQDQVNSWIFLAAGSGTDLEPVTFKSIVGVADGINHAVPTQNELQTAFGWLLEHGLVRRVGKGFVVTSDGSRLLREAGSKSNNVSGQWKYLENQFRQVSK